MCRRVAGRFLDKRLRTLFPFTRVQSIQDFAAWHSLPLFCLQVKAFNMPPGPPLRARAAHAPRTRVTGQREREACPE
jgi:hypothetical protein